jgi:hypothetical protein
MTDDYCAELVTFTVAEDNVPTFLERRSAAIKEVKAAHPDLWAVPMCARREDGTWVDLWIYTSRAAADAANADAANLSAFLAMVELLSDVAIEVTQVPPAAISPL